MFCLVGWVYTMAGSKKEVKVFPGQAEVRDPAEIGEIVRQLRKAAKLTQVKAAEQCKVGTRFLSDFENGKVTLQLGKALQVLSDFGLLVMVKKRA